MGTFPSSLAAGSRLLVGDPPSALEQPSPELDRCPDRWLLPNLVPLHGCHFFGADDDGCAGMLLAHTETPLGRVPKQVL